MPPRPRRSSPKNLARASGPRTRLDVEQRRAQLLALGLQLFADRSYDEISIDELASAAGISKGLLYHYFSSKRDFYIACVRMAADRLVDCTKMPETLDPLEQLRRGLEAYLDFVEEHGRSYAAVFRAGIGTDEEVAAIIDDTRATILQRLVEGLGTDAVEPPVRSALRGWLGYVEAVILDWVEFHDVEREQLIANMIRVMEAALASSASE
ncbi:MAG: TetR/AcrR family transcriptional regulator [Myxococcota bacterium]